MDMYYETDRLILRILMENSAQDTLHFFLKNKDFFEPYEPDRPDHFYTKEYQAALLHYDFLAASKGTGLRFWVFPKEMPSQIIGTVSFQHINRSVYQSCLIGYKFDTSFHGFGYATEAIQKAISVIFSEWGLHRIEALVMPENDASMRLLTRIGFVYEGICKSCVYLHSKWTDHIRFSYINRYQ